MPEFNDFLEFLTDNARASLRHADTIARGFGAPYIGTEHLLLGVLAQKTSIASKVLESSGITLDRAKVALNLTSKRVSLDKEAKGLSETAKLTLKMSWDVAKEFSQDYCGTEHILFSILSQKNARATVLLRDMSIDLGSIIAELEQFLSRQQYEFEEGRSKTKTRQGSKRSTLDTFGTDLTEQAARQELDVFVGRETQLRRVITILNRRTKNNPVLIGEPGVGKTAIIEGLAQLIVTEQVPDRMLDKRIVSLDMAAMIAGTKFRGEFEERLKRVLAELSEDDSTIVFIDELHLLVGAGAAEGAIDAGNILKPALARGKVQVIGATTTDEYSKYIEKDSALERRFQPILVPEATKVETLAILRGLRSHYSEYHGVTIEDEILKKTVRLSSRYINGRFLPDKAIDLLDESAATARIERGKASPKRRKLLREHKLVVERMEEAGKSGDYERAARFKLRHNQLARQLKEIKEVDSSKAVELTEEDLADAIATITGIPVKKVRSAEAKYIGQLEKHLAKFIVGQKEAISAVSKAIRRSRSGVGAANRPIGSFIFLGPTGVGKTELARVLAKEYFGQEDALVKIDMSEMSERHNVSRLVGAPAGYVGFEEGGQLTDKIRRQPYSLVLFDEVEKAHPDVFNILLQVLEDGYLTDAKGRRVDFTNTMVVMTSNVGAEKLQKEVQLGFKTETHDKDKELDEIHEQKSEAVLAELDLLMKPELLNRIDKVIVFKALTKLEARNIMNRQIKDLEERLSEQHLGLKISPAAKQVILEKGFDPANGVRPLRRAIQDLVEDEIANKLLDGSAGKGDIVLVSKLKDGKLGFAVDPE